MLRIVSNRGIAGRGIDATLIENGQAGKQSVGPGLPSILGSRKTDVGAASAGNTCDLERSHDGIAVGERARLNFRLMLALRVDEGIHAELGQIRALGESGSNGGEDEDGK